MKTELMETIKNLQTIEILFFKRRTQRVGYTS